MDPKPSRAKRRISSRPSHGFLERLRRSTLCALVSFTMFVIACFAPDCFVPENKKTHRQIALAVGYKCRYYNKLLRSATSPRQCTWVHNNKYTYTARINSAST